MGSCCSQLQSKSPFLPSPPSVTTLTDLRKRPVPPHSPSSSQVSVLLDSYLNLAYQRFSTCMSNHLSGRIMDGSEFETLLNTSKNDTIDYFRSLFVSGTPGEIVPFDSISSTEQDLETKCKQDFPLYAYCNMYRSFRLCTSIKKQLVEEELIKRSSSKMRILRQYDQSAAGVYRLLCRNDLEILIIQASKSSPSSISSELAKQTITDREILLRERRKAEEISQKPVPESFFSGNYGEKDAFYEELEAKVTVIDLISRFPEDTGGYFTLQGEIVARGPVKKHKSAGDRPDSSCNSQKVHKFTPSIDE